MGQEMFMRTIALLLVILHAAVVIVAVPTYVAMGLALQAAVVLVVVPTSPVATVFVVMPLVVGGIVVLLLVAVVCSVVLPAAPVAVFLVVRQKVVVRIFVMAFLYRNAVQYAAAQLLFVAVAGVVEEVHQHNVVA